MRNNKVQLLCCTDDLLCFALLDSANSKELLRKNGELSPLFSQHMCKVCNVCSY